MSFVNELKRRNVFRVAIAYAVIAWVLIQIGDILFDMLELGPEPGKILLAILLLGFLPAIIFAWAFEITPEGIKKEKNVQRDESITSITAKKLDMVTIGLLVVAIGLFGWQQMKPASVSQTASETSSQGAADSNAAAQNNATVSDAASIAVLPFADMSPQGDQAYFADGISEELLNVLAKVDGLKVAARTSSFKFRGDEHDIVEIGEALKVKTVLEGSIRKAGNSVRITAQLIDVAEGYHLWSESYDRELDNIFAVQDEIARSIVDALKLKLQLDENTGGSQRAESGEAYDLYLRGLELAREPSKEGLTRALKYFEQALQIDPDFASAHGAISRAWISLENYGGVPTQEAFDQAELSAKRALELDPESAGALTAMGTVQARKYDNDIAARDYYERALKANPAFIETYSRYADILSALGEHQKSIKVHRDAVDRDPLSSFLKSQLASMLAGVNQFEEAQTLFNELLADNPNDAYAREEQGQIYLRKGQLASAILAFEFVHDNRPGDPFAAYRIAQCYTLMMMPDKAQEWIAAARARGANNRWELSARYHAARNAGDWDTTFRVGQLYLSRTGANWQGLASLGKKDWEIARASYQRDLSRLNYRTGDEPELDHLFSLTGLAFAEKRLDLDSWSVHLNAAKRYAEKRVKSEEIIWYKVTLHLNLAFIAAIESDADGVVEHMQLAGDNGFFEHTFIEHSPFFADLRDEPRLIALADKMREHVIAEREKLEL